MEMITLATKAQANAAKDFALANGASKVTVIKLVDCFLLIAYK